jgi:hypothetical protein
MRNGFAGELLNSVIVNTGQAAVRYSGGGNPTTADWANRDVLRIVSSTFSGGAAISDAPILQAIANGDAAVPAQYQNSGTANYDSPANFSLVNADQSFNPQGTGNTGKCNGAEKATKLDPRIDAAASDDAAEAGGVVTGPDPAGSTFRGAFPSSGPLWTDGWTAASQCGLI